MSDKANQLDLKGKAPIIELRVIFLFIFVIICFIFSYYMFISKINSSEYSNIQEDVQHLVSSYSECHASKIECIAALEAYARANKMQKAYPLAIEALKQSSAI